MTSEHTVRSFDQDLDELRGLVAEMGALAEQELADVLDALAGGDAGKAATVAAADEAVNRRERAVEEMAVRLIAMRQPKADDLRLIIAGLRAAEELERIGDQAKNIAYRLVTLVPLAPVGAEPAVCELGEMVRALVRDAVDAFVAADLAKAEAVRARDVDVDRRHTQVFGEVLALNEQDASRAAACTHLSLVLLSLERIGDHATNIAEEAMLVVTGHIPDHDRKKADESFFVSHGDGEG